MKIFFFLNAHKNSAAKKKHFTCKIGYCKNLKSTLCSLLKNLLVPTINLVCKAKATILFYQRIAQAQSFQVNLNLLLQQISQVHYLNEEDETNGNLAKCIKRLD